MTIAEENDQELDEELDTTEVTKATRERSTIVFPYFGLAEAAEVARVVHSQYGGRCEVDQLAASLNQKASSGAFRLKLSAARMFGLVTISSQAVSVTDLGSQVADERTAPAALAKAFLEIPLYTALYDRFRNRTLPNDRGLEAAIRDLGVTTKQVQAARQAMQRSAEHSGFFAHGRDRLIAPAVGRLDQERVGPEEHSTDEGNSDDDNDGRIGDQHPIMKDPLIVGLLERLPDPNAEAFPEAERDLWLSTLEMNLAFIYGQPSKWKFTRPDPGEKKSEEARSGEAEIRATEANGASPNT
jgi:hypothetical protein